MADWRKIRAQVWRSWLQGLPDEIYDKRDTSHIVRLLDVLCGENGVGSMRRSLILKRLQTSLYETRYRDLDTVYSEIFALPRLTSEQYEYREDALLLWSEIQEMDVKDAMYRQRIWAYMLSFQYGGTVQGLALAGYAATGIHCEVADGMLYYRSAGVPEEYQGDQSGEPLNYSRDIDFNGVTILVDTDEELTAEQQYNLSNVTARLRPVDVHYTFMTRKELMEDLCFSDFEDEIRRPLSVVASSHWWSIVRMVTGRPDWGLGSAGNNWIEAGVTKEAPQQLLSNSQEIEYDFTSMVSDISASSEHVGSYNAPQRVIFESLATRDAQSTKGASNALSQASSRIVSNGYYGDQVVIDGAYPESYSSQLTDFYKEVGRSHRYWSSDEREGSEWLEIELKRMVPVNYVTFAIYRKPVVVTLYFSSYKNEDGERVWVPAKDHLGNAIKFTYKEWGGTASGEMVIAEFDVRRALCDAVRLEFERLDIPHYTSVTDDTYTIDEFKWSIECLDVSVQYKVKEEGEFVPATYDDMFGNKVDTYLRTLDGDRAIDGDGDTYWVSQPNIGENAVEYLILKVADEPVRVNFIDIEAVYAGCQMNVYSTQEDEPVNWIPYPQVYTLRSGRTNLPMRKVTHIKLEFTNLCGTPYDLSQSGCFVETRLFPWDVRTYIDERTTSTYENSREEQLYLQPQDVIYDNGTPQNIIGIEDYYIVDNPEMSYVGISQGALSTFTNTKTMWRQYQDNSIIGFYGDDMALESYDVPTPDASSFGSTSVAYRFSETGPHEYEVKRYERTRDLAYVVGVKDVSFGYNARIFTAQQYYTFYMYMQDQKFIDVNDGWVNVSKERLQAGSDDRLNYFETVDLQSLYPFRSFEMATNQKPAVEKFEHPSDMVREWHGYGSDVMSVEFGASGTVLQMKGGKAIESEPKLSRSMAVGKAQVDVYPLTSGRWNFECYDLFGESVFSLYFDLEAMKWQTVGATFVPMPGGTWWDSDYPYRVTIPIKGPVAEGSCVFVPVVDIDALRNSGMIDANLTKLRLVYYNGVDVEEIPLEINDNMEMWFRLKQDVPDGRSANGRYDFDDKMFYGVYHLYFGNGTAQDAPKRDYRDVFDNGPIKVVSDVAWLELKDKVWGELLNSVWDLGDFRVTSAGTIFGKPNDRVEVENEFFLPEKGFLSFEVELDDPLLKVDDINKSVYVHTWDDFYNIRYLDWYEISDATWESLYDVQWGRGVQYERDPSLDVTWGELLSMHWGSEGVADVRFMLDYVDAWKRMQIYTHEKQLVFVIRDKNGFESSFVSLEEDLFKDGEKSHVLVEWDVPGTADIEKAEFWLWSDLMTLTWEDLLARHYYNWNEIAGRLYQDLLEGDDWGEGVMYDENLSREVRTWDKIKRYPSGLQIKNVDPNDKRRRWIGVWVDSAVRRRCIPNVYDEKWYIETNKVY